MLVILWEEEEAVFRRANMSSFLRITSAKGVRRCHFSRRHFNLLHLSGHGRKSQSRKI